MNWFSLALLYALFARIAAVLAKVGVAGVDFNLAASVCAARGLAQPTGCHGLFVVPSGCAIGLSRALGETMRAIDATQGETYDLTRAFGFDAAHAMSPVGGVGINLAIQDAVATWFSTGARRLVATKRSDCLEAIRRQFW